MVGVMNGDGGGGGRLSIEPQIVKHAYYYCKMDILTCKSMGSDSLWKSASSGQMRNCSFLMLPQWLHFSVLEMAVRKSLQTCSDYNNVFLFF